MQREIPVSFLHFSYHDFRQQHWKDNCRVKHQSIRQIWHKPFFSAVLGSCESADKERAQETCTGQNN